MGKTDLRRKKMMNRVTIAIPVYNVRDYIARALLAALNQSFEDCEIMLIDDRGSDDSMEVVKAILKTHPHADKVRILTNEVNVGLGEVRNRAVRECETEYLFFLDSDDEITADCIQSLYDELIKVPDADFVAGAIAFIYDGNTPPPVQSIERILLCGVKDNVMIGRERGYLSGSECNKLYKTDFLRKNGIRNKHRIGEDHYWCLQEVTFGRKIVCTTQVTYYYHLRQGSITDGYNKKQFPPKLVDTLLTVHSDSVEFIDSLIIPDKQYLVYFISGQLFALPLKVIASGLEKSRRRIEAIYEDAMGAALFREFESSYCGLNITKKLGLFAYKLPKVLVYPYWRVIDMLVRINNRIKE